MFSSIGNDKAEISDLLGKQRMLRDIYERYPAISWEEIRFDESREIFHVGRAGWHFKGDQWQRSFRASVKSLSTNTSKFIKGSLIYHLDRHKGWVFDGLLID